MEHAKRLYLIDEFDSEYKCVQRPSAVVAKARSAVQLDANTLRSSELDDHEKARQYVAELHRYLNVTAPPPAVRKRVDAAASRPSSSTAAPYFRPLQTRSQLRQQQQQLLRQQQQLQQQQQQLLQHQWARRDPDGDIEDDDDGDAEDEDVDEVFSTPLLPPTPPSVARPAAKKFKSTAAATTAGGKKKSPSISKKIQQQLERARSCRCHHSNSYCRQKESSSLGLAMMMMTHRLCTPPIRCPASSVASVVRVVCSSECCLIGTKRSAIFVHRMRTRYTDKREDVFRDTRHTRKELPTSNTQISSTCRVCRTSTTRIAIF